MIIPFQERQPWKLITQTVRTELKVMMSLGTKQLKRKIWRNGDHRNWLPRMSKFKFKGNMPGIGNNMKLPKKILSVPIALDLNAEQGTNLQRTKVGMPQYTQGICV